MDKRVEAVLARLANHPGAERSIRSVASSVNLSASRLRHLFKQDMGTPLGKFVRRSRVEHAAALLDNSFLSVKQVMYEVGLTDETYFIREFKKEWGMTPGAYRRSRHGRRGGWAKPKKPTNSHSSR